MKRRVDDIRGSLAVPMVTAIAGLALASCVVSTGQTPIRVDPRRSAPTSVLGAVGCSQTRDAIQGYHRVGTGRFWPARTFLDYGGATLDNWANPNDRHWPMFQSGVARYGADAVWFEICVTERTDPEPRASDLRQAETVVQEIRRRAPGVDIYVSAQNDYVGIVCHASGPAGPTVAAAIADHLVAKGLAKPGPVVGPLDDSSTIGDDCHANRRGKLLEGRQLARFFDSL